MKWHTPIIPVTWEVVLEESLSRASLGKSVRPYLINKLTEVRLGVRLKSRPSSDPCAIKQKKNRMGIQAKVKSFPVLHLIAHCLVLIMPGKVKKRMMMW
jgi:hypothetical protein